MWWWGGLVAKNKPVSFLSNDRDVGDTSCWIRYGMVSRACHRYSLFDLAAAQSSLPIPVQQCTPALNVQGGEREGDGIVGTPVSEIEPANGEGEERRLTILQKGLLYLLRMRRCGGVIPASQEGDEHVPQLLTPPHDGRS